MLFCLILLNQILEFDIFRHMIRI